MKRLAIGALMVGAWSAAGAQSSVSLYGIVDLAVRQVRNGGGSATSLSSNGNNTSRFGVKGIEDLGGGLKAGFQLEAGLNPDSGTQQDATRFWNRRSTVSIIGSLGELRLGRDYSVTYQGFQEYDVWADVGLSSVAKFDSSLSTARDTGIRADNQVAYFTPANRSGFYARAAVAPGEGVTGKKYFAGRAGYASGPLDVSVTYGQTTVAPVAGEDKFKTLTAGAAYDFGVAKISGYVTRSRFAQARVTNFYLGAQVPAGAGVVRASYIRSDLSGTGGDGASLGANDASQWALGYLYNLSNRTALYTNAVRVRNGGESAVAVDKNPPLLGGLSSSGVELGVRHTF